MSKRKILCQECPLYNMDGQCPHKSSRVSPDDEACAFGKRERIRDYHRNYGLKRRSKRVKKPVEPRACAICGKEFLPIVANQKCCSPECQKERRAMADIERVRNYKAERGRKRSYALRAELQARLAARDSEYARQFPKDGDMAATTRGRIPGGYSHAVNKSGLTVAI